MMMNVEISIRDICSYLAVVLFATRADDVKDILLSRMLKELGVEPTHNAAPLLERIDIHSVSYVDSACGFKRIPILLHPSSYLKDGFVSDPESGCLYPVVLSAFYLLSRYEEIQMRSVRDSHGRYPGKESLAYKCGFLTQSIVTDYGMVIQKTLNLERLAVLPTPVFRVCLTHDVDIVRKFRHPWRALQESLKLQRRKRDGLEALLTGVHVIKDPYDSFALINRIDATFKKEVGVDVERIYFFMAGGSSEYDNQYSLEEPKVRDLIRNLHDEGCEIGLHVSYEAGGTPENIKHEKAILEEACGFEIKHSRHHYLRFREPEHLQAMIAAGIEHDYSVGYADRCGFRTGYCSPYPLFDWSAGKASTVMEHPLTIMECTLDSPEYLLCNYNQAKEHCECLVHEVKRAQGELVLLWHNTEFRKFGSYQRKLYQAVLEMV